MSTAFTDHLLTGTHAARPAASAVPQGTLYACTTHGLIYKSDGVSTWSEFYGSVLGGSPTLSYGSNATHVAEISLAGASNAVARADHYHAGIAQVTSSSSNTLQRGTLNLRMGNNMSYGLTDTDGDGEFDTLTFHAAAAGGVGGGGTGSVTALNPSSDTYINSESATTNFDTSTELWIGGNDAASTFARKALLTFDTSALAGKTIHSAILRLYRTSTSANAITVGTQMVAWRLLRAYVSSQATWNVYSTGNSWTTAGARSAGNDKATIRHLVGSMGATTADVDAWYSFQLAQLLQESIDASESTFRVALQFNETEATQNNTVWAALDHATSALRPKLLIVHS